MPRSLWLSLWLSFASVLSLLSLPARAADPLVGQRVVVIRDQATLEAGGKAVAKVRECSVFTVESVEGSLLWIKSQRAYLRRADVVPFDEAIVHYMRLLKANQTAKNYWNRAQIWRLKGELDIAIIDMYYAIDLNSTESAWFRRRGILWYDKKQYDKAIADYSEAIRLNPKSGEAYHNRGVAWSAKKDYDKEIADYDEALKHIDPNEKVGTFNDSQTTGGDSTAMVNLRALMLSSRGSYWWNKGNYDKAIADYEAAIRLDPKYLPPFFAFARLRATCPDAKHRNGQQAVAYATKACELTAWKDSGSLDTLAAAYAEASDFDKAVEWQKKAMDLAPADWKAEYEAMLKLYQEKKSNREPAQ